MEADNVDAIISQNRTQISLDLENRMDRISIFITCGKIVVDAKEMLTG